MEAMSKFLLSKNTLGIKKKKIGIYLSVTNHFHNRPIRIGHIVIRFESGSCLNALKYGTVLFGRINKKNYILIFTIFTEFWIVGVCMKYL